MTCLEQNDIILLAPSISSAWRHLGANLTINLVSCLTIGAFIIPG